MQHYNTPYTKSTRPKPRNGVACVYLMTVQLVSVRLQIVWEIPQIIYAICVPSSDIKQDHAYRNEEETDRQRQTDRQTDGQTETERDKDRKGKTKAERETETETDRDRETGKQTANSLFARKERKKEKKRRKKVMPTIFQVVDKKTIPQQKGFSSHFS